jgi:hypothetical protein
MKRFVAYGLVVAATMGGSWLVGRESAEQTLKEVATLSYFNQVDGCLRGNLTVRRPARDFMVAFIRGERDEPDDPNEVAAARVARHAFVQQRCLQVVRKVGPAESYIQPEDR